MDNENGLPKKRYDPYIAAGIILWLILRGFSSASAAEISAEEEPVTEGNVYLENGTQADSTTADEYTEQSVKQNYSVDANSFFIEYPGLSIYVPLKETPTDIETIITKTTSTETFTVPKNYLNSNVILAGSVFFALPAFSASIKQTLDQKVPDRLYKFNTQTNNLDLLGYLHSNNFPVESIELFKISDTFVGDVIYTLYKVTIYVYKDRVAQLGSTVPSEYYKMQNSIYSNYGFTEADINTLLINQIWVHNFNSALSKL